MNGLNRMVGFAQALLLLSFSCLAAESYIVEHYDPVTIDPDLSLSELVDQTVEKYPDISLIPALMQEAEALQRRGNSWLAGAPSATITYYDDGPGSDVGFRELEGAIQLPLWNWGQREAGQQVAKQALQASEQQENLIRLQVAGLVRQSLWEITLEEHRYKMALLKFQVSERLLKTVKRRVDLGDLPRADFLLAKSELLKDRSELVMAEAEQMHARKRFSSLTQSNRIPAEYKEQQSEIKAIAPAHPALNAINALIARKRAELEWVKAAGSGQTVFAIGGKTEGISGQDDDIASMSFNLSVPFGGSAHRAPEIATANLELAEAISRRDHLFRELNKSLHEAEHALEVDRAELVIANELKDIAKSHMKMTRLSFTYGEIGLMDLLKIQTRTQAAIRHALEQAITLHRDIALYNQTVGVQP